MAIAIGRNAVTNLLNMMVLTTLGRMVIEDYWLPEVWGEEKGKRLLAASIALEEDIWTVANDVLTADQQKARLSMIADWHAQNPDQIYPWLMRMSMFSGQRAAQLSKIKKTGGLMKEVRAARETAEEVREMGERSLFYIQRAPRITSDAIEAIDDGVEGSPGVSTAIDQLISGQARLIDRFFILMGVLMVFFFLCMLGYRLTAARLNRI